MIPTFIPLFRHDAEAEAHAERHRPFSRARGALSEAYAARYGARAAAAAQGCRDAFARGDARGLRVHAQALALILRTDHLQLFEHRPLPRGQRGRDEKERK